MSSGRDYLSERNGYDEIARDGWKDAREEPRAWDEADRRSVDGMDGPDREDLK